MKIRLRSKLLLFALCAIIYPLFGCGGGSAGTGSGTVSGTIETTSSQPLAGVTVTVTETGDSAVTAPDGTFTIVTGSLPDQVSLAISSPDLNTVVPVSGDADGENGLKVQVIIDTESKEVTVRALDILAAIQGMCDAYFENDGLLIKQIAPLNSGTSCTTKVRMFENGNALRRKIAMHVRSCDEASPWRFIGEGEIRATGYGQIIFTFDDSESNCIYRVTAPYNDPNFSPVYTYIATRTAQRLGVRLPEY